MKLINSNQLTNDQKGFFPVVLGVLVLLAITGGAAYYLGTQKNNSNQVNQTVVPSPESATRAEWKSFESNPKGISLKYPGSLLACGNRQGEMAPAYVSVRTSPACDSSGAPENDLGISDISKSVAIGENQLYNYLKDLPVGQTKQGETEGEKMAGLTYKRLPDTQTGGYITQNYQRRDNNSERSGRNSSYSFVKSPNNTYYSINQHFFTSSDVDYANTFKEILETVEFTQ